MEKPLRLTVENLACSRGESPLFRGLSFALESGRSLIITGANGVGKTTLLRALAGFLRPDEGSVRFDGAGDDVGLPQAAHFVGHRDGLRAALTVRENLAFAPALLGGEGASAAEAAERLDLVRLLDLPVGVLSAGQRRRTALARLLAARRPVWLLDEPTTALDARSQDIAGGIMAQHAGGGGIVIAATHQALGIVAQGLIFQADGRHSLRPAA